MSPALSKLLHSNRQLFRPQEGFGVIDMAEWMMLLDMDNERYAGTCDPRWSTMNRPPLAGIVRCRGSS